MEDAYRTGSKTVRTDPQPDDPLPCGCQPAGRDRAQPGAAARGSWSREPAQVGYDPAVFTLRVEELPINDPRLALAWGTRMCRLVFTAKDPQAAGSWKITVRA